MEATLGTKFQIFSITENRLLIGISIFYLMKRIKKRII